MKNKLSDYGMLIALVALCALFAILTIEKGSATSKSAAVRLASEMAESYQSTAPILVAGEVRKDSGVFAHELEVQLRKKNFTYVQSVVGTPRDLRLAIQKASTASTPLRAIVAAGKTSDQGTIVNLARDFPSLAATEIVVPTGGVRSVFLTPSNFEAIISRVVAIAVVAIGMTLVILTGGIDLSVGSLLALAAVVSALIISQLGGADASAAVVAVGFLGAILVCGLVGASSGFLIAHFRVAPFITTLAFMMMARGFAKKTTGGFTIEDLPDVMTWLGLEKTMGIPNTIWVLVILYVAAHWFMSQTRWGRYIYAVGGNEEAARLSGIPVKRILIMVYIVCGLCAGLGGCIQASQIKVGTPNIGIMFELNVIAAVVVGGTSLAGGSGKIFGTLIGALIIAVIQNGMNLLGLKQFDQEIVLGAVILFAVLLDKARSVGWGQFRGLLVR